MQVKVVVPNGEKIYHQPSGSGNPVRPPATGGRGTYHMECSHYEEVPQHLQAKIISASKAEKGVEEVEEV